MMEHYCYGLREQSRLELILRSELTFLCLKPLWQSDKTIDHFHNNLYEWNEIHCIIKENMKCSYPKIKEKQTCEHMLY